MEAPHQGFIFNSDLSQYIPIDSSCWQALSETEYHAENWLVLLNKNGQPPIYLKTDDNNSIWLPLPSDPTKLQPYAEVSTPNSDSMHLKNADNKNDDDNNLPDDDDDDDEDEKEEEEDIATLNLVEDVVAGCAKWKCPNLVFRLKELVPTDIFEESAEFNCLWTSLYEGRNNPHCAEFFAEHFLASYLGTLRSVYVKSLQKLGSDEPEAKRFRSAQPVVLQDPVLASLEENISKGIKQTNHNYLQVAKKQKIESHSDCAGVVLYGPDAEGDLKLITYVVGRGCKVYLCRQGDEIVSCCGDDDGGHGRMLLRLGQEGVEKEVFCCDRSVDFERDNWILAGNEALWKTWTPRKLNKAVMQALREEFEEFVQEAHTRFYENNDEETVVVDSMREWFTTEAAQWIRSVDLGTLLEKRIQVASQQTGIGLTVLLFGWRPLEALIGGNE